jgi:hypothetical protein
MTAHLTIGATALACFAVLVGACSAESKVMDEGAIDEGALSAAARRLVGLHLAGDDTYAVELELAEDGSFRGQLSRTWLSALGACRVPGPCTSRQQGRWSARQGRLELRMKQIDGSWLTRSVGYRVESAPVTLVLDGVRGEQRLARAEPLAAGCNAGSCPTGARCIEGGDGVGHCIGDPCFTAGCAAGTHCVLGWDGAALCAPDAAAPGPGCDVLTCRSGLLCEERSDGEGACLADTSFACEGKACGDECSLCIGCADRGAVRRCGANGQCQAVIRSGRICP